MVAAVGVFHDFVMCRYVGMWACGYVGEIGCMYDGMIGCWHDENESTGFGIFRRGSLKASSFLVVFGLFRV